ncbi:MAG TPA: hypothetical protein VEA92_00325 [Candidatus Paceibacterota bacterium]|nr:hypothetical protein [Candidatus Paceibacterota bacterium]
MKNAVLTQLSIAALFLIASVAAYVFSYLHVEGIGSRIVSAETEAQQKNAELMNIHEAQSALSVLTESEARIKGYFVPATAAVSFLESVGTAGDAFGADVSVVSVNEDTAETGRTMLSLALQVRGSFEAVMRTVGTLEFAPYDITLTNISLDATDAEGAAWTAAANFTVGTELAP